MHKTGRYHKLVGTVLSLYEVDVAAVSSPQKGYRNESYKVTTKSDDIINLMFFKPSSDSLERIKRADQVSAHCHQAGLPVRVRADQRIVKVGDSFAAIYNYLPGKTVPWEGYTKRHIKLLGLAMAEIHSVLKSHQHDGFQFAQDMMRQNDLMRHYFSESGVKSSMKNKLELSIPPAQLSGLNSLADKVGSAPHQQSLHLDMVRGNVLFDAAHADNRWQIDDLAVSGVIDFEKTAVGPIVVDLARTLAFLYIDCSRPATSVFDYFINSGYAKRGKHEIENLELLAPLIKYFLLYDFYKFLRHTPYESLANNWHFIRTRQWLLAYGIIRQV